MKYKKHEFNSDNFETVVTHLEEEMKTLRLKDREIRSALLMLEELWIFMREAEGGDPVFTVQLIRRFVDISLVLACEGEAFNPLDVDITGGQEDENYYRSLLINANRRRLSYVRRRKKNTVSVRIEKNEQKNLITILMAIALGIAVGILLRSFGNSQINEFIYKNITSLVTEMYISAMKCIIAPIIFLSIVTSICRNSSLSEIGRMGVKVLGLYAITTIIASVIGAAVGTVLSAGITPVMFAEPASESLYGETAFSIRDTIAALVPTDLASPVLKADLIQIVVFSLVFAASMCLVKNSVSELERIFEQLLDIFGGIMGLIVKCLPVVIFCAMISPLITMSTDYFTVMVKIVLGTAAVCALLICVYVAIILLYGKISPLPFVRKALAYYPVPFALSSSSASIPQTEEMCEKSLGIPRKLSAFSISIGATVNMDGLAATTCCCIVILAVFGGMDVTWVFILKTILVTYVVTVTAPAVPGGTAFLVMPAFIAVGIPEACFTILLALNSIIDMMDTATNVTGDIAVTTAVAAREGIIDRDVYMC